MTEWNPPHYHGDNISIEGITIEQFPSQPELKPTEKPAFLKPLPNLCCSTGAIPASYLESLSYEQQLMWLCHYLETVVIPSVNQNASSIKQLQSLFKSLMKYYDNLVKYVNDTNKHIIQYINNTLNQIVNFINTSNKNMTDFINQVIDDMKKYIDDSFADLNVQDEINNKLDQMVEDGTLAMIINQQVLNNKLSRFIITPDMTIEKIQTFLDYPYSKILEFQDGEYTINTQLSINSNTTILLNDAIINSTLGYTFTNFKNTDTFTEYNGNSNISIIGGTIRGGICFCHCKNISLININFEKCPADHFIQIAAGNGINISGCTFDGVPNDVAWFREYVQIDNMDFGGFPLFDENNPTYDNTVNKNWLVENCSFLNNISKTDNNYTMRVGIGNHASNPIDERLHENITIRNCIFDGTTSSSLRAISMRNFVVENCIFKTDNEDTESNKPQLYIWYRMENAIIKNNTFQDNFYAIIFETPKFLDNITVSNNIFKNYNKKDISNNFIIKAGGVGNLKIINNQFLDNTQIHLKVSDYSYNENINTNHSFEISNNLFKTNNSSNDILQLTQR